MLPLHQIFGSGFVEAIAKVQTDLANDRVFTPAIGAPLGNTAAEHTPIQVQNNGLLASGPQPRAIDWVAICAAPQDSAEHVSFVVAEERFTLTTGEYNDTQRMWQGLVHWIENVPIESRAASISEACRKAAIEVTTIAKIAPLLCASVGTDGPETFRAAKPRPTDAEIKLSLQKIESGDAKAQFLKTIIERYFPGLDQVQLLTQLLSG